MRILGALFVCLALFSFSGCGICCPVSDNCGCAESGVCECEDCKCDNCCCKDN